MSSLKRLLDHRRVEESVGAQLCHTFHPQASSLTVVVSPDEKWILPWHHLASAHLTRTEGREQLRLSFTSHEVVLDGINLGVLADLVGSLQLASLRAAPTKYAKATDAEPFIDALRVTAQVTPRNEDAAD